MAVPSLFTLLNLFSGFLALTQVHTGQFTYACYLIVLAGFFDVLDGMMARLSQGQSRFGVELDSLSDIVSFGVAPSYLVYVFALSEYGVLGVIVSALPVLCAAVRLARYNVSFDGDSKEYFAGLPVPIHALAIIALVLNGELSAAWLPPPGLASDAILLPVVFVLSALMVTSFAFEGTPKPTPEYLAAKPLVASGYGAGIVVIVVFREVGLLIAVTVYILEGILCAIWRGFRSMQKRTPSRTVSDNLN